MAATTKGNSRLISTPFATRDCVHVHASIGSSQTSLGWTWTEKTRLRKVSLPSGGQKRSDPRASRSPRDDDSTQEGEAGAAPDDAYEHGNGHANGHDCADER